MLRDMITDYVQSAAVNATNAATTYGISLMLILQEVNWTVVGGLILFLARAAIDIPKAIDYWIDRSNRKKLNDKSK